MQLNQIFNKSLEKTNGRKMKEAVALFIVIPVLLVFGQDWSKEKDFCLTIKDESLNTSGEDVAFVLLKHDFLNTEKGIFSSIKYRVVLRKQKFLEERTIFILTTNLGGTFGDFNKNTSACDSSSTSVIGDIGSEVELSYIAPQVTNDTVLFFIYTRTLADSAVEWSRSVFSFQIRSGCFLIAPRGGFIVTSEQLSVESAHYVLIRAPKATGQEISLEHVSEDGRIFIHLGNESASPISVPSVPRSKFSVSQDSYALIDMTRCEGCTFGIEIKPLAKSYECNSTLRIAQGDLDLVSLPYHGSCEVHLEAPTTDRVLLRITDVASSGSGNCVPRRIHILGTVIDPPTYITWSSCGNTSGSRQNFYISQKNNLRIAWNQEVDDVQLHYEFIAACANQTFGSSAVDEFCSVGYPDVIFGCDATYSIQVPLGYSIELQLNVHGTITTSSCPEGSLEVDSDEGSQLLSLCFQNTSSNVYTLRTASKYLEISVRLDKDLYRSGFCASYKALPQDKMLISDCPYGWVSGQKFCYKVYDQTLDWFEAEQACVVRNGHLASVTDNDISILIDDVIKSSHEAKGSYWIGANDLRYENSHEWADGQTFDFNYWFPGWDEFGGYGMQPSDDGLSSQDCVEIRDRFRYPSKGEGTTGRFYWNDRDCSVRNSFVCQRIKPGVRLDLVTYLDCNKTITLTWDHPQGSLTSPGFSKNYPNNMECFFFISSPEGTRIVAHFTDFVLEDNENCEYDAVVLLDGASEWRRCGDWEGRLKLLRHVSRENHLQIIFTSDFAHTAKGFRVVFEIFVDFPKSGPLCENERFQLRGQDCYLVVDHPETKWSIARDICSDSKASLVSANNPAEVSLLSHLLRHLGSRPSGAPYWIATRTFEGQDKEPISSSNDWAIAKFETPKNPGCSALQQKESGDLQWISRNCDQKGRFVCIKPAIAKPDNLNRTFTASRGNFSSVNYPSNYLNNLDYTEHVSGSPHSRLLIYFQHFELEWQQDCLYDYIFLRTNQDQTGLRLCGDQLTDREFISSTNEIYLDFHSDFSVTASGFRATWEGIDLSPCLNRRLLISEAIWISSLRYPRPFPPGVDCRITATAIDSTARLLFTVTDLDIRPCQQDFLEINLDPYSEDEKVIRLCGGDIVSGTQLLSYGSEVKLFFSSMMKEQVESISRHRGYNITCEEWKGMTLESTLHVAPMTRGRVYSLNFNLQQPVGVNYSQTLLAPLGRKIYLHSLNISQHRSLREPPMMCEGSGIKVWDVAKMNTILVSWSPCNGLSDASEAYWSSVHMVVINAWNYDGNLPSYSIDYSVVRDEESSIPMSNGHIESCHPNPCWNAGQCYRNGSGFSCHCLPQYTGLLCHKTWCDVIDCEVNGMCKLTPTGWTCQCSPGFVGERCRHKITPCYPNPCGINGECLLVNDTYSCKCDFEYEGVQCEKFVLRIPYKPLSERMLEEPFWLGLITVFSVLLVILFVYCIKRKFADKIEKFLAEEIEKSKYQPSPPVTRYSLSSTQHSLTLGSPQSAPKSLFSRIRKNSILNLSRSPSGPQDREQTAATSSFDDFLRRKLSSTKKTKSPSKTPSCSGTLPSGSSTEDIAPKETPKDEKSRILSLLVSSNKEAASRRMSLDEFFRMNERKLQLTTRKTNSPVHNEGENSETSFITTRSPNILRKSFTEIQSIQEQSFEYMSSSESFNEEPVTSEVHADVTPTPTLCFTDTIKSDSKSPDSSPVWSKANSANDLSDDPSVSNPVKCEADSGTHCSPSAENFSDIHKNSCAASSTNPVISKNSNFLEVPQVIPSIQVFSEESSEPHCCFEEASKPPLKQSGHFSPCKKNFAQPRKYSVDLPVPKILITTNTGSCDSDDLSPPRTPNPNKSMMYLSPLAVISSANGRTISESNLSTSGYSSISSPGLSRCNSSSPISDDVEQNHHPNCSRKVDLSPKKSHGMQMTYLSVGGNDKTFFFPQTVTCHCHTPSKSIPAIFESKPSQTIWIPEKQRPFRKRNSYQTTSTDDSIDDEGIGMDSGDFKNCPAETIPSFDVGMFVGDPQLNSPRLVEADISKKVCLPCSANKTNSGESCKSSPRIGQRKGEKTKKHVDKHRRSPILSPSCSPDSSEVLEIRIPRNSSRTSMIGVIVSSSESDDPDGYLGARQKTQTRRSKRYEVCNVHKQPSVSGAFSDKMASRTDKKSDNTGRSSPMSESNGDSAPMDSRSPATSSSESLSSRRDSVTSEKAYFNQRRISMERAQSIPPVVYVSSHTDSDEAEPPFKTKQDTSHPKHPIAQKESDDNSNRQSDDHPYLRRQEAIVEDDPSDDSSSETTILLGRQSESPRSLPQSSSADISEWEPFSKD